MHGMIFALFKTAIMVEINPMRFELTREKVMQKQLRIWIFLVLLLGIAGACSPLQIGGLFSAQPTAAPTEEMMAAVTADQHSKDQPTATPLPVQPTAQPAIIEPENIASLQIYKTATLKNPYKVKWSQDSRVLGAMTADGLMLLDGETLEMLSNVQVLSPYILVDYSPDKGWMALTVDGTSLEIREIATGNLVRSLALTSQFNGGSFSADGSMLVLASTDLIEAQIWNADSGAFIKSLSGFETAAPVYSASFAEDNSHMIWVSRAHVQLQDIPSGILGNSFSQEDFVGGYAMSPNGNFLATATSGMINDAYHPFVRIWNPTEGVEVATLLVDNSVPYNVTFSPNSRLLAASDSTRLVLWETSGFSQIAVFNSQGEAFNAVAFSPDGKTLATSSSDGNLTLWKVMK